MRRTSGQAVVELALGGVVFVGVLLAGIHLAEYAQLSLKVQEAQMFAMWDAAGRRVQSRALDGTTNIQPFMQTLDTTVGSAAQAERRYADFDGLSGTNNGAVIARALTQGSRLRVECRAEPSMSFPAVTQANQLLWDVGGISCEASAQIRPVNLPTRFFRRDGGGFFSANVVREQPTSVCGLGLPVAGQCRGRLAMLTNDWGLANDETAECKLDCTASKYRAMVQRIYGGGGSRGALFAAAFAGAAPTDANIFRFSYAGVESEMKQAYASEGDTVFPTGGGGVPGGMVPHFSTSEADTTVPRSRPRCFLGKACPQ